MIFVWILAGILGLVALIVLFLAVCALLVDGRREYEEDSAFYRFLLYTATAVAVWLFGIRVRVFGAEKLPSDGRFLLVGNHCSNFDPIVTWHALKKYHLAFVSKPENFKIPIAGRIVRRCCFLAIDRENPRNAVKTIEKAAQLLKRDVASVCIYPEGTRSKDGTLLSFHNGAFKIAQKAKVPIVVMAVLGTDTIKKNCFRRKSDVRIVIADVIPADAVCESRTGEIGERVRTAITQAMTE